MQTCYYYYYYYYYFYMVQNMFLVVKEFNLKQQFRNTCFSIIIFSLIDLMIAYNGFKKVDSLKEFKCMTFVDKVYEA
jgi:hypothetical protein